MTNFCLIANCSFALFYVFNSILGSPDAVAVSLNPIASAEKAVSSSGRQQTVKPKFPDRGIPTGRRRGGTSRNGCEADRHLTAIVPGKEIRLNSNSDRAGVEGTQDGFSKSESFLTRTVEEYPSFWVYVPESTNFEAGEFVLQDERDRDVYRTSFALPSTSRVLEIKLPPQAENSLITGQKYHWYVKAFCGDEEEESGYVFVDAWIERVAFTAELQKLLSDNNANRYQVFKERNLWHDAIDVMAENRQKSRKDYDEWNKLLDTLGLSDLIDKSVSNTRPNFPIE